MDIHTVDSDTFSAEDVIKAHMEDLSVQDRFGVKQIKYWVNVSAKTLFCLMEGPDKESCHAVHVQSHGQTACNIIEVNDDEFHLFLGEGTKDGNDLAQTVFGEIDTGYRTIMAVQLLDLSGVGSQVTAKLIPCIRSFGGTVIPFPNDLMATFVFASDALRCTNELRNILVKYDDACEYRLALLTGRPVDEVGNDLFENTKKRLSQLCMVGNTNEIYIDNDTIELSKRESKYAELALGSFNILRDEALLFLEMLFTIIKKEWNRNDFKSDTIHSSMGISKSQLYRKLKSLTNLSPNQLIQEMKFRQAARELIKGEFSVSQVAYGTGFNSPTYFTRTFKSRFGVLPTEFTKRFK